MFFFKKNRDKDIKSVSVMNGSQFVAAYSQFPFEEDGGRFPDYSFHKIDGMYWCVRIGDIVVPWGFSARDCGFSANGVFVVSRANVSAATLDAKGFRYIKEGDVFYLYENEIDQNGEFYGFSVGIKEELMPIFKHFASCRTKEAFVDDLSSFSSLKEVTDCLAPHYLKLTQVRLDHIQ